MTMELATEVYNKDSIQNKKCNPRNTPATKTTLQSFVLICKDRNVFQDTKGTMINTVINSLYIPATEGGVVEDFIMIEEMETANMLTNSKI
ncbi:hypothetical protein D3C74_365060 [compost metagenome]